jgi:hypothetical protein
MPDKPKSESSDVWINPRSNIFRTGHQAWDHSVEASDARYLELADVALRSTKLIAPVASVPDSLDTSKNRVLDLTTVTNHE